MSFYVVTVADGYSRGRRCLFFFETGLDGTLNVLTGRVNALYLRLIPIVTTLLRLAGIRIRVKRTGCIK